MHVSCAQMKKPSVFHLMALSMFFGPFIQCTWGLVNRFKIQGIGRVLKSLSIFTTVFLEITGLTMNTKIF